MWQLASICLRPLTVIQTLWAHQPVVASLGTQEIQPSFTSITSSMQSGCESVPRCFRGLKRARCWLHTFRDSHFEVDHGFKVGWNGYFDKGVLVENVICATLRYLQHATSFSHSGFPRKLSSHQSPLLTKGSYRCPSIHADALACVSARVGNCLDPR